MRRSLYIEPTNGIFIRSYTYIDVSDRYEMEPEEKVPLSRTVPMLFPLWDLLFKAAWTNERVHPITVWSF